MIFGVENPTRPIRGGFGADSSLLCWFFRARGAAAASGASNNLRVSSAKRELWGVGASCGGFVAASNRGRNARPQCPTPSAP